MTTVVFGSRGNVGSHVLAGLRAAGEPARATSRVAGPGLVVADLREPATLGPALDGAERAFLYAHPEGIDGFVRAARQAGLRRVVLLSTGALARPGAESSPIAERHRAVEEALEASGLEWTFVRAGMFATNTLAWRPSIVAEGRVRLPYPEAFTAPLHEADIAAVAVTALLGAGHAGQAYPLWGPQSLTLRDQVGAIAAAVGRPIAVETVTPELARIEMSRVMPEFAVNAVLGVWAAGVDRPAAVSTLVPELTGRPARTYREWAVDHSADFRPVP